jgi:hypothetical protein
MAQMAAASSVVAGRIEIGCMLSFESGERRINYRKNAAALYRRVSGQARDTHACRKPLFQT